MAKTSTTPLNQRTLGADIYDLLKQLDGSIYRSKEGETYTLRVGEFDGLVEIPIYAESNGTTHLFVSLTTHALEDISLSQPKLQEERLPTKTQLRMGIDPRKIVSQEEQDMLLAGLQSAQAQPYDETPITPEGERKAIRAFKGLDNCPSSPKHKRTHPYLSAKKPSKPSKKS